MNRLKIIFEKPENAWMGVKLALGESVVAIQASSVPRDSVGDLANAICLVLKGAADARVIWNEEPTEYEFNFSNAGEVATLHVFRYSGSGRREVDRSAIAQASGTRLQVCLPFWRALRQLQSLMHPNEYELRWGRPFPSKKLDDIADLLG